MVTGRLIEESLDDDLIFRLIEVLDTEYLVAEDVVPPQPTAWSRISFRAPEHSATDVAECLAATLKPGPWYARFDDGRERCVVFSGRIFRYERGDAERLAAVERYARSVGVPDHQFDWDD